MNVTTRPATEADEPLLFDIYCGSRAPEMAIVPWSDSEKNAFLRFQFDSQLAHYRQKFQDAEHSVIEWKGSSVGRLYIDRRPSEIRILDLAVLPEYRGRGIGTAILVAILKEASDSDLPVTIYVESYLRSFSLFERLGFVNKEHNELVSLLEWSSGDKK